MGQADQLAGPERRPTGTREQQRLIRTVDRRTGQFDVALGPDLGHPFLAGGETTG